MGNSKVDYHSFEGIREQISGAKEEGLENPGDLLGVFDFSVNLG
jgi:hypothetical protein